MSRLSDLLRQLRVKEPQLAQDLEREVAALADRRAFGLNFERHVPESVELPRRKVRKGDKVRILPPRGQVPTESNEKLWRVIGVDRQTNSASLVGLRDDEPATTPLDDLVVVAEFRDPIYPGLISTGKVQRGGEKPFHIVINADNYYALETLLFTHRGKVDCIYIDPPYNTGARDWKYNNDYVEGDDLYRHSKWLAFMERRLLLARELLNPKDSVLIVSIDEKEYLRLGLLLEQTFPEARRQMVSVAINPAAVARGSEFRRSDEYYFCMMFGEGGPKAVPLSEDWITTRGRTHKGEIRWDLLRRSAEGSARSDRPNMFYPVFVETDSGRIHSIGNAISLGMDRNDVSAPDGTIAAWPIRKNGTEGRWRLGASAAREAHAKGYLKIGAVKGETTPVYYLTVGEQQKIDDGIYEVLGRAADGSVITSSLETSERRIVPSTQWKIASHDSTQYGSRLLQALMPDRRFPFPKSLYAVEDALRFFVADKPNAVIVDFFAGSGTTAHAVMRLNRQDNGHRQCLLVTNNEVAADEQSQLRSAGLRPGDPEWESRGVFEHISKPRLEAAVTGRSTTSEPIKGSYKFIDEFPIEDGFNENIEFFSLTYETPLRVTSNREFVKIAPLLWMRAGGLGRRINAVSAGWDLAETYGVLQDLDDTEDFLKAVAASESIEVAYIVTDEDHLFQSVAQELPERVEPVRLYEAYLRNFEIESGRGTR